MQLFRFQRVLSPLGVFMVAWALLLTGGCETFKTAGDIVNDTSTEKAPIEYEALAGQSCAIMVWVDRGTRIDFPYIQSDIATVLQDRLSTAQTKGKEANLENTTFVNPRSVLRYQREHPEIDGLPITETAPKLGVSRVIYIEVERFETRSPLSIELYRGMAKVTLRVAEVKDGLATVTVEQPGVTVVFPPKSKEGLPGSDKINDTNIYRGTVVLLAKRIGSYFGVNDE